MSNVNLRPFITPEQKGSLAERGGVASMMFLSQSDHASNGAKGEPPPEEVLCSIISSGLTYYHSKLVYELLHVDLVSGCFRHRINVYHHITWHKLMDHVTHTWH
jgi:hypothetical protein